MRDESGYDAGTVHDLLARLRHVQTRRSYAEAVQAVVDGVVAVAGFDVAALRVLRDGAFHCEAVASNPENPHAQVELAHLGPVPVDLITRDLDRAERLGDLMFVPHDKAHLEDIDWVPDIPASVEPGVWHPLDALYAPMHDDEGRLAAVLLVDLPSWGLVPDEHQAEILALFAGQAMIALTHSRLADRLREREREFRLAFDRAANPMALATLGAGGGVVSGRVNPALSDLLGRSVTDLARTPLAALVAPGQVVDLTAFLRGDVDDDIELRALHADGTQRWVRCQRAEVERSESTVTVIVHVTDIAEERRRGAELLSQASRDDLTGLWNRRVLHERLTVLAEEARASGEPAALLFVDVDGFKHVNDSYGHLAGDRTLVAVARRLLEAVRPGDSVVRVGGDEFVVLLPGVLDDDVTRVVERIKARISRPISLGAEVVRVTASVGAALTGPESVDADELVARADADMYVRKRALAG